jgi:dihydroxy-acid dehydratase
VVLHVAPDAASGGPLARIRSGDRISISVKERRLDLLVPEGDLAARDAESFPVPERGWARLYREQVLQADLGCDLDFLRRTPTRRPRGG